MMFQKCPYVRLSAYWAGRLQLVLRNEVLCSKINRRDSQKEGTPTSAKRHVLLEMTPHKTPQGNNVTAFFTFLLKLFTDFHTFGI